MIWFVTLCIIRHSQRLDYPIHQDDPLAHQKKDPRRNLQSNMTVVGLVEDEQG